MTLPEHLFIATGGDLHDTREPNWSRKPLRAGYATAHGAIDNVAQLKATLRYGPYAWPGGYAVFFICSDGAVLCPDCVRKEFRQIADSVARHTRDGWRVVAADCTANVDTAEDGEPPFACEHCNKPIGE